MTGTPVRERMPNHECPAPGCTAQVPYEMLACRVDWFRLPQHLRNDVNRAWYGPGALSDEHNDALAAALTWYDEHPVRGGK